jgi:hypothetical protein
MCGSCSSLTLVTLMMEAIRSSETSVHARTTRRHIPEGDIVREIVLSGYQKSRRMRWAGHVAQMGEKRNVCRLLVGKPEGKRPLGNQEIG